mmetsp:Transcript_23274/g.50426  ORF Transcript_23274/g.50426 Transcript_23274/m.50426 type:complete len:107 (+) Transcript_23274:3-323(+)
MIMMFLSRLILVFKSELCGRQHVVNRMNFFMMVCSVFKRNQLHPTIPNALMLEDQIEISSSFSHPKRLVPKHSMSTHSHHALFGHQEILLGAFALYHLHLFERVEA